jgi:5-methylcytosine-specific restriction endonuclease McrA
MKTIEKYCLNCGNHFYGSFNEHKRGNAKFCTRGCASQYNQRERYKDLPLNCECAYCKRPFHRAENKIKISKSGLQFCSRNCKDIAQRISSGFTEIQPSHYGTGDSDYRSIAFTAHPHKCNKCPYDRHPEVLQVHHKDRNRSNNTPENLEILCPTCHEEDHFLNNDGKWTKCK